MTTLLFFHDPMCSWCWGYRPTGERLLSSLPDGVAVRKVLGGLAPDSDEPMPASLRSGLPKTWRRIRDMLGTEFNFDFWEKCEPRRSTYPACRAVLAAGIQYRYDEMIDAIQRAYYLRAMNPSDLSTLEALAAELNLDRQQFSSDIRSPALNDELMRQVEFSRHAPIRGFPSLVLDIAGRLWPLTLDYYSHETSLTEMSGLIAANSASTAGSVSEDL